MTRNPTVSINVFATTITDGTRQKTTVGTFHILFEDKRSTKNRLAKIPDVLVETKNIRLPVMPIKFINDSTVMLSTLPVKRFDSLHVTFTCPYVDRQECPNISGEGTCENCQLDPYKKILSVMNQFAVKTK